jgi:hypothetical protein
MEMFNSQDDLNKAKWKCFTQVVDTIVDLDGKIFGGAVRDILARDMAAVQFYEETDRFEAIGKYTDPEFHPASKDRMLIPSDIDACIHASQNAKFIKALKDKNFKVATLFHRDAKRYIPHLMLPEGDITHYRLKVTPRLNIQSLMPQGVKSLISSMVSQIYTRLTEISEELGCIYIDLMVEKRRNIMDPPYGGLDFECNGLIMDKGGVRLCDLLRSRLTMDSLGSARKYDPLFLQKVLLRIQEDIRNKRAIRYSVLPENTPDDRRVEKMIAKGYTIKLEIIETIEVSTGSEEPDTCIICHDELTEGKHHKLSCCNARYHPQCLVQMNSVGPTAYNVTGKCVMCRQTVPYGFESDIQILEIQTKQTGLSTTPLLQENPWD